MTELILRSIKRVKRLIVAVIGFTVLLICIAMVILHGPAFVLIPIGLGILAGEFFWARKLLYKNLKQCYECKRLYKQSF